MKRYRLTLGADGRGELIDAEGARTIISAPTMAEARIEFLRQLADQAAMTQSCIQFSASDPTGGPWHMLMYPDGHVEQIEPPEVGAVETVGGDARQSQPVPPARTAMGEAKRGFLSDQTSAGPPLSGWAKLAAKLGIHAGAGERERREWEEGRAISQHWPGPRTIAVLNGKGGAGKTPTTILLSAMFARAGGAGVLAWDNNITRGPLGWRTERGTHDATVLDLLPHTDELLAPDARAADLAAFVHHQTVDKFDVLRSNPLLKSTDQMLTPSQLDAVHAVAAKYYRLIFMDSGNDEGAALWLRMVDKADHIVVPTTTRPDHAEAARLLLDDLAARDEHGATLSRGATVIVSQADREEKSAESIADAFKGMVRDVVTVPYDPAMRQQWLRVDALAPETRSAYRQAAAAVARSL